ncbi:MAG: radical SAM protein [Deltaproteobacteria bacterium]|nr:radical SAM protein [Deltaproteobacteria bacterium]
MLVSEIFDSIQGETIYQGIPMTFVRLAGCNLRCVYCDTRYAYEPEKVMAIEEILDAVARNLLKYVCLTGGEPMNQRETPLLINGMLDNHREILMFTNGTHSLKEVNESVKLCIDIKLPSSFQGYAPVHPTLFDYENLGRVKAGDEVKFVIQNRDDMDWVIEFCAAHPEVFKASAVSVSPAHGVLDPEEAAGWIIKEKLPFRLNVQMHKLLNLK